MNILLILKITIAVLEMITSGLSEAQAVSKDFIRKLL